MEKDRFVTLALAAFALIFLSFMTLGLSRIVLPFHVAQLLAAPFGLLGFGLVVLLFLVAVRDTLLGDE